MRKVVVALLLLFCGGCGSLRNFLGIKHEPYTLLHFWAPWCSVCKPDLASLNSVTQILAENNIIVRNISVKEEEPLAAKYGVEELPVAVLLDSEGKQIQIKDPEDLQLKKKVVGPRFWSSERSINALIESTEQ